MELRHWPVLAAVTLIVLVLGYFGQRFFHGGANAAQRRLELIGVPFAVMWVVAIQHVDKSVEAGAAADSLLLWLGIVAAAISGLALVGYMYLWLQKADEMIRRAETESMALGFGISMVVLIALDQLGSAGIGFFHKLSPGLRMTVPMFMAYAIGRVVVYLRYR